MQLSFGSIYKIASPAQSTATGLDKYQKKGFEAVLQKRGVANEYYSIDEQKYIRDFVRDISGDYNIPKNGENTQGTNRGATSFSAYSTSYLCTGRDSKNVSLLLDDLKKQNANTEKYNEVLSDYVLAVEQKGKMGYIKFDTTDGRRYNVVSINTPYVDNETQKTGYKNACMFLG